MCGRTACTLAPDDIVRACTYKDGSGNKKRPIWKESPGGQKYWPSCNISPTSHTPVLVSSTFDGSKRESSERTVIPMKWGLTPSWHKGDPYKVPYETNNCRAEGMSEKKTYKVPLQKGFRCVVLADGYFEWKTTQAGKQPYFFYFTQPINITYPGETVKSELLNDVKEEKVNNEVTYLDKPVKQEVKSHGVMQEIDDVLHNDIKIKQETPCDASFENSHLTAVSVTTCVLSDKTEIVDGDTKFVDDSLEAKLKDADDDDSDWKGQRLLTMAGVYDVWIPSDGSPPLYSYSIITVSASSDISFCHHRMPAILSTEDDVRVWLDSAHIPLQEASSLIKPYDGLLYHPVSKSVNNSRYKSPDCVKPVDLGKPKETPSSNMMVNWLKSGSPAKRKKVD